MDLEPEAAMHGVPLDLDLSQVVGECATQIRVGQFDLQFTLGPVKFLLESLVALVRNGEVIGTWEPGRWPDSAFFEVMNSSVSRWEIPNSQTILIHLENGIELQLKDDSDRYECMQITVEGRPNSAII